MGGDSEIEIMNHKLRSGSNSIPILPIHIGGIFHNDRKTKYTYSQFLFIYLRFEKKKLDWLSLKIDPVNG